MYNSILIYLAKASEAADSAIFLLAGSSIQLTNAYGSFASIVSTLSIIGTIVIAIVGKPDVHYVLEDVPTVS